MGRARPEAYPVLGEEPCLDTAYVLGMAGPAWCSRCGPPEREGKAGGTGGKRVRRNGRNRAQDGEKRGGRGERRKKVGKDGQIDRQPREAGSPAPSPHPPSTPDPDLWLPGSHLSGDGPLRTGAAGSHLTGSQPQGPARLPNQRGPYFRPPVCSWGRAKEGKHGA